MNQPPLPQGQYLDLPRRGRTFFREVAGPGPHAPTLLLLHGWTATADLNWFQAYRPLGRSFRVIALDHRGHGRGIRTWKPFRLEDCADDAAALVRELGVNRVIPVGYSMGGPIAQLVWKRHRDLVDGLVLCATSRNFGKSWRERAMFASMLGLSMGARVVPEGARRKVATRVFERRLDDSPIASWVGSELQRHDATSILRAGWAIGSFSSAGWIHQVDVPTSVLVTTQDSVVHPSRQRKLAASIPEAKVFEIPADHAACAVAPHHFVPGLIDACQSVVRRRAGVFS